MTRRRVRSYGWRRGGGDGKETDNDNEPVETHLFENWDGLASGPYLSLIDRMDSIYNFGVDFFRVLRKTRYIDELIEF